MKLCTPYCLSSFITHAQYHRLRIFVTVYGKTRHMGFFVKIKFDVYLISSTLELTYLQVRDRSHASRWR